MTMMMMMSFPLYLSFPHQCYRTFHARLRDPVTADGLSLTRQTHGWSLTDTTENRQVESN